MLASSDLATFVALVLLILVILLALRLRRSRQVRQAYAQRLARATGHPSAGRGPSPAGGYRERQELATLIADGIAGLGLVVDAMPQVGRVTAQGAAGTYAVQIGLGRVHVGYDDGEELLRLGTFEDADGAIAKVAEHGELRVRA